MQEIYDSSLHAVATGAIIILAFRNPAEDANLTGHHNDGPSRLTKMQDMSLQNIKLQHMKVSNRLEHTQTVYSWVLDFAVVFSSLLRQRFNSRPIVAQVGQTTHANYEGELISDGR